jgi:hypothetical protein
MNLIRICLSLRSRFHRIAIAASAPADRYTCGRGRMFTQEDLHVSVEAAVTAITAANLL